MLIVVCVILGGVVAAGTILGWISARGKRARQWAGRHLSRRPSAPRTRVHIEPNLQMCRWCYVKVAGVTDPCVSFEMHGTATNLTPAYDLKMVRVDLKGISGRMAWNQAMNVMPGRGGVQEGSVLPAQMPMTVAFYVALERDPLPPRPVVARMKIRDHVGQDHRSPKITFEYMETSASPFAAASSGANPVDQGSDG